MLNTLFIGRQLTILPESDSTNSHAVSLLAEQEPPEGLAVLTYNQTQGRGQREAKWESEPGKNITCSFVLRPTFLGIQQQFFLSMAVALAVYDTTNHFINKYGLTVKWPNDIYFNDLKLAGILIENTVKGTSLNYSVVGIGLNINQSAFSGIAANPTSLKMITDDNFRLEDVFFYLCSMLEKRYLQLKNNKLEIIKEEYIDCLYRLGELHSFIVNGSAIYGTIQGVNNNGHLQLLTTTDGLHSYDLKEIKFVI